MNTIFWLCWGGTLLASAVTTFYLSSPGWVVQWGGVMIFTLMILLTIMWIMVGLMLRERDARR